MYVVCIYIYIYIYTHISRSWKPWKPCKTLQGLGKEDLARLWKAPRKTPGKTLQGTLQGLERRDT